MYIPDDKQLNFNDGWFIKPELNKEHFIVKLTEAINWDNITTQLSKFYRLANGRPTKPARVMVGLLFLQRIYKLSDEETVRLLHENVYAQYLCNISLRQSRKFVDRTTLVKFRKRIGLEGLKIIEQEVFRIITKISHKGHKRLVLDTTIIPSAIQYPTDIDLLNKARNKIISLLDQAKAFGAKTYRTYKRTARKVYLSYCKLRKRTKKVKRKIHKKLIQFTQRNLKQLVDVINNFAQKITPNDKNLQRWLSKANNLKQIVSKLLNQQKDLYLGKQVKERIVSLWATHIRPMVRGKFPTEVEFGPKVSFSLVGKYLFLNNLMFENTHDSNLLVGAIEHYKNTFGSLPNEIATDRGFYSKANVDYAKSLGINRVGIQKKGKSLADTKPPPFLIKAKRLCCRMEAKISLAKRRFGLNRIRIRIPNAEEFWTRLGLMVMNLKSALDYG